MQQYCDSPLVINWDEDHVKMVRFLRHLSAIGKSITPGIKWTFDGRARKMVDEIEGVKHIHSSVMKDILKLWKAQARLISRSLTSMQNTRGVIKAPNF